MLLLTRTRAVLLEMVQRRIPQRFARLLDAEDIVQEAHVEAFRRIGSFSPQGEDALMRWLSTIALSRLRNALRDQRTAKRGGRMQLREAQVRIEQSTVALFEQLSASQATPSRAFATAEAVQAVRAALQQLPPDYAEAVRLVHLEGGSVRHAALRMRRSERAIHGLCRRGLAMLRRHLRSLPMLDSAS